MVQMMMKDKTSEAKLFKCQSRDTFDAEFTARRAALAALRLNHASQTKYILQW